MIKKLSGQDALLEINRDGKNDIRKIKSRSGHEIIFRDEKGKEGFEIRTKSGHRILLDDSIDEEKIEIKDKAGNSIFINSAQNSVSISSIMKISIEAQMIEIKARGVLNLQGALVKIN